MLILTLILLTYSDTDNTSKSQALTSNEVAGTAAGGLTAAVVAGSGEYKKIFTMVRIICWMADLKTHSMCNNICFFL